MVSRVTTCPAAVLGSEALVSWLRGQSVSGFLTIVLTLLILGSFIMISLGIIGIYIAKIYEEVKRRPLYIARRRTDVPRPRNDAFTTGDAPPPGNGS